MTFRRLKQEAKQGIGELDWPLIFVPSPVRIAKRFVDTGNSSVCHLTTKMQKAISISVVRELMSTYVFFPLPDRNQNQNFFFVLSRKWSLMKTVWFQQLNGIKFFFSLQLYKICEYSFYLFLFYVMVSQTELIRWRIWMPRFLIV